MPIIVSHVNVSWQRLFILLFIIEGALKSQIWRRTGHFENEIGFFQEFLEKNNFLCACYLGFD